jgi:hypothetical protein
MSLFLPAFFGAIGVLILALGIRQLAVSWRFLRRGVWAEARVVSIEREQRVDEPAQWMHYPVFTFTDANGRQHTVKSTVGTGGEVFGVGDAVAIRYLPEDPQVARIDTFSARWGATVGLLVMGTAFLLFAVFVAVRFGGR